MKRKALFFLIPALLLLCVLPAWNLAFRKNPLPGGKKESLAERLYSTDLFVGYLQELLLPLSVSLNPEQVVIGKDGWLFLGDGEFQPLTKQRFGVSASQRQTVDAVAAAMKSWDEWFRKNGVRNFRIMICPDKSTIYPEHLPGWIGNPPSPTPGDLLSERLGESIVYLKDSLLAEKSSSSPLYYPDDTHWNARGAWIGYERFFRGFPSRSGDQIRILGHDDVSFREGDKRFGDLPRLLKLPEKPVLRDVLQVIGTPSSIMTEHIDKKTGKTIPRAGDALVNIKELPVLVRSPSAINDRRVLWIRDSYGTALSPYMAATFSEVMQVHFLFTDQEEIRRIVREFRPDDVLFTVVERQILADWFTKGPVSGKEVR